MSDDVVVFRKDDLPNLAFPIMEDIRRRGKLCDVTLMVGEQKFSAHRIVLAASIPYFHAMFTHDMMEHKQDVIKMQGLEPSALEILINFAYCGRIQIDTTNVENLLVGANFLQLHIIKDACCDFLMNRLHPNNVLGIRAFAEQFMCKSLIDACNKYLQKYFQEVTCTEEFLTLQIKDVVDLLSRDELYVASEEKVFEAAMAWVRKDTTKRDTHTADLLRQVRLPLLTPHYLADKVAQEEVIRTNLNCRDLVDEAKDYHLMPERRAKLQTFKTRPRCCTDIVGIIYAVGGLTSCGDSISTVEYFDPIVNRWQVAEPMSTLRSRVGISVLEGQLYAIGGYDGLERLNTVEVFDREKRRWNRVAAMLNRRSALGAGALGGKLYVCGGYDGVSSLCSVECYEPQSNTWTMVANMTRHRSAAGVCVFDGQIYALGGHDGLSIFDSVECYNNSTGLWSQISPMLSKRCRLGVAALNGKLYAAGGYDGNVFLKTVECYDPVLNQWTMVAKMNVKRSRVALVSNHGKLYAIGGYDGVSNLNTMEIYDPEKNEWKFGANMRAHEGGVGVGVIPLQPLL